MQSGKGRSLVCGLGLATFLIATQTPGTKAAPARSKATSPKSVMTHRNSKVPIDTVGQQMVVPLDYEGICTHLTDRMNRYWNDVNVGPTRYGEVRFTLHSNGRYSNLSIARSMGDARYDAVCRTCVDSAGPFAPFEGNGVESIECIAYFSIKPNGGDVTVTMPGFGSASSMADKQIANKRKYNDNVIKIMRDRIMAAQKVLGSDSPKLSESINFMANAQKDNKDWVGSEASFKWAIAIRKKSNGLDSPELAESYADLGEMYRLKGDLDKAEESFKTVINNPNIKLCKGLMNALQRYGTLCLNNKRPKDSELLYKRLDDLRMGRPLQPLPPELQLPPSDTAPADTAPADDATKSSTPKPDAAKPDTPKADAPKDEPAKESK